MKRDPLTGIGILEETLDYADSSEDRVQGVLRAACKLGSSSDELAAAIIDWPTRYHFSRMRRHLLAPLNFGGGDEILDLGCGTGPITRALGESGARVLGLEGSLDRARAAAIRCEELPCVEIMCGDLHHYEPDREFDVICCVGVLEYAASSVGGSHGAHALLQRLESMLAPDGVLLLAIENQLGLKYLLGYREDHVGLPWVGLEGYPVGFKAQTWSRRALGGLLKEAGFAHQRWFFPFPDYKLPAVILSQGCYEVEGAAEVVDQLVRLPVEDFAYPRTLITDDRAVHRSFLQAGLGPDVANSFLVLAGRDRNSLRNRLDEDVLAWHLGGERRALFKRQHRLMREGNSLRMISEAVGPVTGRHAGWLEQRPNSEAVFVRGLSLEQDFLASCGQSDEAAAKRILRQWKERVFSFLGPVENSAAHHPFAPRLGQQALPPDMADLSLSNFIRPDDGSPPVLIDREWVLEGGVDPHSGALHALWFAAHDLVRGGGRHPWPEDLSVDGLALHLGHLAGLDYSGEDIESFIQAEAEFQALVTDRNVDAVMRDLQASGGRSSATLGAACPLRWTDLPQKCLELLSVKEPISEQDQGRDEDQRLLEQRIEELEKENSMWRGWRDAFESRVAVRFYRRLQRIFGSSRK